MKNDLVNVKQKNADVIIDLRYASENNFTSQKIFNSNECYIHNVAFEHLCKSIEISKKLGYKLKIFDAYRPVYVQKALWNKLPDPNFIAPPEKGSPHSRGVAIDLTLTRDGEELIWVQSLTNFQDYLIMVILIYPKSLMRIDLYYWEL